MTEQRQDLEPTGGLLASRRPRIERFARLWFVGALVVAGCALAAVHAWSLLRYPAPYVDEVWIVARLWRFLQTGETFGPLDVGILDRVPNEWRTIGYAGTALPALGLLGADGPGLLGPRAVSLAFGGVLLAVLFLIGRLLAGSGLGALAALLTGLSAPFFYSGHMARPDIIAAAFAYAALAIHLANSQCRPVIALASGFCLCLGFELHPNAALLGPTIVILFLLDFGFRALRQRHFWGFVSGLVLGLALHLVSRVLPDPAAYVALSRLVLGPVHTPSLMTWDPAVISQAFAESWHVVRYVFPASLPVLAASLVSLIWKPDRLTMRVAAIAVSVLLSFTLLVRTKQEFYLIWLSPALDLVVATFLWRIFTWKPRRRALCWAAASATAATMAVMLNENRPPLQYDLFEAYGAAQSKINAVVGPGDSVMGRQQYWLGLTDHTYYSWEGLVSYFRTHPGSTLEEAFAEHKPDILIIDGGLAKFISDKKRSDLILETLRLPASQMTALLRKRGTQLTVFDSYYGRTGVFRLRWDGATPSAAGVARD